MTTTTSLKQAGSEGGKKSTGSTTGFVCVAIDEGRAEAQRRWPCIICNLMLGRLFMICCRGLVVASVDHGMVSLIPGWNLIASRVT